jgi:secreted trypsin-like serine protease
LRHFSGAGIPGNYRKKIVGGFSVEAEDQFPYQASLRTSLLHTHFCGAFILTERWLGTAGESFFDIMTEINCFLIDKELKLSDFFD